MIFITLHALQRAKERGIKTPTPRRAFTAIRRGKYYGDTRFAYEWRGIVWVFTRDFKTLKTVYRKEKWDEK